MQLCGKLGEGEVVLGSPLLPDVGEVPVHRVVLHHGDPRQRRCALPEHKLRTGGRVGGVGVEGGVRGGGVRVSQVKRKSISAPLVGVHRKFNFCY